MNFRRSFPFVLTFILVFTTFSGAQSTLNRFVSGEGNFSIAVDGEPNERKPVRTLLGSFELVGESVSWKREDGTFIGIDNYRMYGETPEKLTLAEKRAALQHYKKSTLDEFAKLNIATSESPFVFEGFNGVEIRGVSVGRLVVRIFIGKNRLYALSVVRRGMPGFDSQIEILNTFRLLSKDEYIAARISENTPASLPQAPPPKIPLSDVAERGLKGKESEIIEDFQQSPKAGRKRWGEEYYDERGNLIKEISFLDGYPSDISVWGWVDSMRVSRSNHIDYPLGEGPNEIQITSILEAPREIISMDAAPPKTLDERFASRYETKFDLHNRPIERTTFSNDGTVSRIEKFVYSAGRRERIWSYDPQDSASREIQVLDAAGNVIEEQNCDENGRKCEIETFRYEFDTKGNWVVKRAFEKRNVKGRSVLKSKGTHFRTIKYYG